MTDGAHKAARKFFLTVPVDVRIPAVESSEDGEVNLVWRSDTDYLEVGFCGGPEYSWLWKLRQDTTQREFEDGSLNDPISPALLRQLAKFLL